MPTAEMYEQEAKRLAEERDEARRERDEERAAMAALLRDQERQRLTWHDSAMLYIKERDQARAHLALIAASRARRDKRRAGKLAAARIRFLCPGGPVPVQPEQKGGAK
jgi:hypothetical protein